MEIGEESRSLSQAEGPGQAAWTSFLGCCNKVTQTGWLEAAEMYCLSSESQKSETKVSAGAVFEDSAEGFLLACHGFSSCGCIAPSSAPFPHGRLS